MPNVPRPPRFEDEPANFRDEDGKPYLVRCPACRRENWAPAAALGACAWCGWNAVAQQEDWYGGRV